MNFNIARFDLVSIRLVVLCAELGSLSAASRRAHFSVSSASQRLSSLEKALGKSLFVRERRGMYPTDAGQVFVRHGRLMLEHLTLIVLQVADSAGLADDSENRSPQDLHCFSNTAAAPAYFDSKVRTNGMKRDSSPAEGMRDASRKLSSA